MTERERFLTLAKNNEMKMCLDNFQNQIVDGSSKDREGQMQLINEMKDQLSRRENEIKEIMESNKKEIEYLTMEKNKELERFQSNIDTNNGNQNSVLWSQWFEQKEDFDSKLNEERISYENKIKDLQRNILTADSKNQELKFNLDRFEEKIDQMR